MQGNRRVKKLRERVRDAIPELCLERAYLITESYKETESDPPVIRRARALKKVLEEITIHIEDGELIVGRATGKRRGGPVTPEINWDWCRERIDTESADCDGFAPVAEEERARMEGVLAYWKGKSLYDKMRAIVPENILRLHHMTQIPAGSCIANMNLGSHNCVDYELVLAQGLNGVKNQVDEELARLNLTEIEDLEKFQFLSATRITLEAAVSFAGRHAKLARSLAETETDGQRKMELERIADICDWVPANPARSFHEALQAVWFTYLVLMIEGWGPGMSLGRVDQYLCPFYRRSLEEGRITKEEARELIGLLYVKVNELAMPFSFVTLRTAAGLNVLSTFVLGGITADGRDAVNELSYLFLEAEKDVALPAEEIVVRVHKNTPDAFLMKACEVAKSLRGKLKFIGDETAIQALLSDGKPLQYARDYVVSGCALPIVPGRSFDVIGTQFNLPLMLELALNDGVSRLTGEQIGPRTGDPRRFRSYEEVWAAYKKQVEALIPVLVIVRNADRKLFAEHLPTPFQSSLYHGCIQKGIDITSGGTAPYMANGISAIGAPNVGDSLAAIKKAVFEDKTITMAGLIDALDRNFEGQEALWRVLASAPKFGNDDDYVDSIVSNVLGHICREAAKYKGFAGSIFNVTTYVASGNILLGAAVGALPDGRKAGQPLSEGGVSPYQGRNVSGPTATMRSVVKLDLARITGGSALNMRFSPGALEDDSKMRKFVSLIRTYLETGGYHVQFNIVDGQMLREAQRYPERYADLLVRVATYSAFFTQLGPECQNDIIARVEFQQA